MARLAGYGGSVKTVVGTVETDRTGIREWGIDYSVAVLDGRGFDDAGVPNPVIGPKEWGGSFAGPKEGVPMAIAGTAVSLKLYEGTAAGQFWLGSVLVTEVHPAVNVDGLVEYNYTFVGSGALTVATG